MTSYPKGHNSAFSENSAGRPATQANQSLTVPLLQAQAKGERIREPESQSLSLQQKLCFLTHCLVSGERLTSSRDSWQGGQIANQMDHLSD